MSWMRKMAKDDDVSTKSMRKGKRGEDIDMRKWRKEDVEARRKAKKGNWALTAGKAGASKKKGCAKCGNCYSKGKSGVGLPPHPLKKAKAGNWSKGKPAPAKKAIIVKPGVKKPDKRKWYEKPMKILKGRSK